MFHFVGTQSGRWLIILNLVYTGNKLAEWRDAWMCVFVLNNLLGKYQLVSVVQQHWYGWPGPRNHSSAAATATVGVFSIYCAKIIVCHPPRMVRVLF